MTLPRQPTSPTSLPRCPSCRDIDPRFLGYRGPCKGKLTAQAAFRCTYCGNEWIGETEAEWVREARRYFRS